MTVRLRVERVERPPRVRTWLRRRWQTALLYVPRVEVTVKLTWPSTNERWQKGAVKEAWKEFLAADNPINAQQPRMMLSLYGVKRAELDERWEKAAKKFRWR